MIDLYNRVESHEGVMQNLTELVDELKGLSLWEIQRMIDSKKDEMMSNMEENMAFMKLIQDDQSAFKYRLDLISMEEGKQREAV